VTGGALSVRRLSERGDRQTMGRPFVSSFVLMTTSSMSNMTIAPALGALGRWRCRFDEWPFKWASRAVHGHDTHCRCRPHNLTHSDSTVSDVLATFSPTWQPPTPLPVASG